MAQKRCYYEVLGVARTATETEITKAYRALAKKYHPDQNPGENEVVAKYHEVTEAYEILRNSERRQIYDRYGHEGLMNGAGGAANVDLSDVFNDLIGGLFGGGGGRRKARGPQRGADIEDVIDVDLLEAATGVKKNVSIRFEANCKECNGTGAKPGSQAAACRRCKGSGEEFVSTGGFFSLRQTCRGCSGRGVVIANPCTGCRGIGRVESRESVSLDIPPGVDTRVRLTIPGHGHEGAPGAPRGNLQLIVRVREHKVFERDGHNLICQCPITFARAALGGPIELTTLTSQKVTIEVPKGSQTHSTVIRVAGHGMPELDDSRRKGDLMVILVVETPTNLTPEQEQLFLKLAELEGTSAPTPRKGLFGKLKDLITGDNPQTE
ncbi:MAG TPA: molecular chaperone DnaJ [Gemmata sp.]|jgi:molecular chaperone DnaJ|nr:molecular chaperone DnaJ [Gemmata sp.]